MLIGTVFAALLLSSAPAGAAKAQPATPQSTTAFHVDAGKFTFQFPMTFHDETAASQAGLAKQRADAKAKGETTSFCTDDIFDGRGVTDSAETTINVVRLNMACLKKQPTDTFLTNFLTKSGQGMKKSPSDEFSEPRLYMLSVHRAVVTRGSVLLRSGRQTSVMEACAVSEGDVYCWVIRSGSEKEIDVMTHLVVTFEGAEPTLLVPAVSPVVPKPH